MILILSGWAAFAFKHARTEREKAELQVRISQLEAEIGSYRFLGRDIEESSDKIDGIISTLENLKTNLDKLKLKMEKGADNESSQNRE